MGPLRPRTTPVPLGDIATLLAIECGSDLATLPITGVSLDSRAVQPGDLFFALPGHHAHGAMFIEQAQRAGARAVVTDDDGAQVASEIPVLIVPHPRARVGPVASLVYGHPSASMSVLAVTGTNGKTTTTWMTAAALHAAGVATGVIGTLGAWIGGTRYPLARTTPEASDLHALLAVMREEGVECVVMEASSIALTEGRLDGVDVDVALFTHLTQDHLDYHGSMEAYFDAKATLFDRASRAIIGIDDDWGRSLARTCVLPFQTWSRHDPSATWRVHLDGERIVIEGPGGSEATLRAPMPGDFNVSNALCAVALANSVGVSVDIAASGIEHVTVPGRMQEVGEVRGVCGIVDYAHSPDAIERALIAARSRASGRVICVVGAGGDRDRSKRPLMGSAAGRGSDLVIVTDDNPRSEDPAEIRREVMSGVDASTQVREIGDRAEAIAEAVFLAGPGDVVIVLGKGHEQGQEMAGQILPFDDATVLVEALGVA
jgi:UDP-N-acetylmuramoyl-L-alanyl-D-glutamate--2,6-diaminopimelate ligase